MSFIELGIADHILLFLLGIVLPLLAVGGSANSMKGWKIDFATKKNIYFANSVFQWICVLAIILLWWFNNRSFDSLGLNRGNWNWTAGLLLTAIAVLYLFDLWWSVRNTKARKETVEEWRENVPILPANHKEFLYFLGVAFTAGVCEEIIFRGFFVTYFASLNEPDWQGKALAVIIPAFMFSVGHLYQGHQAVGKTFLLGVLFGGIYMLTGSILLLILLHFLVDVIGGWVATRLFINYPPSVEENVDMPSITLEEE